LAGQSQQALSEWFRKILVVTGDERVQRMLNTPFGAILPSAEIVPLNPDTDAMPGLDDVNLVVVGLSNEWTGARAWLSTNPIHQMPPVICIDFSADVGAAVDMMRLGAADYIPSQEINQERLISALTLVAPEVSVGADDSSQQQSAEVSDKTGVSPYVPAEFLTEQAHVKQEMPPVSEQETQVLHMPEVPPVSEQETQVLHMPEVPPVSEQETQVLHMPETPPASEQETQVLHMPDTPAAPDQTEVRPNLSTAPAGPEAPAVEGDANEQTNAFSKLMDKLDIPSPDEDSDIQATVQITSDRLMQLQKEQAGLEAKDSQRSAPSKEDTGGFIFGGGDNVDFELGTDSHTQIAPHINATPEKGQFEVNERPDAPKVDSGKQDGPFSGAWLRMPDSVGEQAWPFSAAEMEEGTATLGNYRVLDFLGVGGMASVFKAQRISDDALFAITVLDPSMADDSVRERFIREFEILQSIQHKHVVKMEEQVEEGGWIFTVMEYLPGGDLKSRIRRRLRREEAVRYASQIAAALQAAHKVGVLHRDLKPANVLFRSDGTLALVDFGVAKATQGGHTDLTKEGQMVGTPYYASPEQATGAKVDLRSDLYALGVILYEMLEGRRPFVGDTSLKVLMAHVKEPVPLLSQEWDALNDVLAQLLAKDPDDRLSDGAEVVHALEEASPGDVPKGLLNVDGG